MIRRTEHSNDQKFTIISRVLAQNKDLSFQARGLLLYVLSKPSNWEVRNYDLCKQGGIGKKALASILDELRSKGYLKRYRERNANGEFVWVSEVFENPQVSDLIMSVKPYPQKGAMVPYPPHPPMVEGGMVLYKDRAGAHVPSSELKETQESDRVGDQVASPESIPEYLRTPPPQELLVDKFNRERAARGEPLL